MRKIILLFVVCVMVFSFLPSTKAKPSVVVDFKITSPKFWISEGQHIAEFEIILHNLSQEDSVLVTLYGQTLNSYPVPLIDWVDMTYPLSEKRLAEFCDKEFNGPIEFPYKNIARAIIPDTGRYENEKAYPLKVYLDPYSEYVFYVAVYNVNTKERYLSYKKAIPTNLLDLPKKPKLYAQLNKTTQNSLETEVWLGGIKIDDYQNKEKNTIYVSQSIVDASDSEEQKQVSYLIEKIIPLADQDTSPPPYFKPPTIVFKVGELKSKNNYEITISAKMPDGETQVLTKRITTP